MIEKIIGVLGGMGPEATLQLYREIIAQTPVKKEQDHLRVVMYSNPKIPSRPLAIQGMGESPVPLMVDTAQALVRAGADFIIMPCVTAHFFIEGLQKNITVPIISIIDVIENYIKLHFSEIKTAGILTTDAFAKTSILQNRLSGLSIRSIVPDRDEQTIVEYCISSVKVSAQASEKLSSKRMELKQELAAVPRKLIQRGADIIVSACTEISLALTDRDISVPLVDSIKLLAGEAVRLAIGE